MGEYHSRKVEKNDVIRNWTSNHMQLFAIFRVAGNPSARRAKSGHLPQASGSEDTGEATSTGHCAGAGGGRPRDFLALEKPPPRDPGDSRQDENNQSADAHRRLAFGADSRTSVAPVPPLMGRHEA